MSVLVVDDSQHSRLLLTALLKGAGYRDVLALESAREAFKHLGMDDLERNAAGSDLILMDITMPELDGIEACRRIKATPGLQDIPIIMVTAHDEAKYLDEAFAAGAMDYITKPVDKVELRARVRSALALKHEMDSRKLAYVKLGEESLAKTQVLSTVSHELKTPLTSIFAYVELLMQPREAMVLSESHQRYVGRIQKNARRLKIVIDDLLDVSRIEAGNLELSFENLEVMPEIEEAIQSLQFHINEKRTNVVLNTLSTPSYVKADRFRFSQVMTNLISNACKYSPVEATVTITVKELAGRIQIDVSDTGMGISDANQSQLFSKFFRADNSWTRDVSGAGLGLFITKHLIEKQGGEIWVESEEGRGSTFSFTLTAGD